MDNNFNLYLILTRIKHILNHVNTYFLHQNKLSASKIFTIIIKYLKKGCIITWSQFRMITGPHESWLFMTPSEKGSLKNQTLHVALSRLQRPRKTSTSCLIMQSNLISYEHIQLGHLATIMPIIMPIIISLSRLT